MKNKIPQINKELIQSPNLFPVVGIGASAGGLDAFKKLLQAIPEDSGMAYVLVQHLDPSHESMLVGLLQKVTNIPVLEISDDIKVQPDHIYIIPSNKMLIANDGVLELSARSAKSKTERNLPIDLFFTSLAEVHQSHAIGVVLSGTASDGTMGLKAIKDHGGITFAQDEASAAYEGMPHSAIEAGVVDFILPPEKIPQKLLEVIHIIKGNDVDTIPQQDEEVFKQILSLLRIRKGTDFTYYKQSTIRRRILRRMTINKTEEPTAYLKYLREKKTEQDLLYQDMLIPVTEFFRDPTIFGNLCKVVFPAIVKNKKEGEPIRIWVAGCSTGEEVYTIAICFKELLGNRFSPEGYQRVQIFATDISEPAIARARSGIYTKSDVKGLSEAHLNEYFTKNNGEYQAKKSIRDLCVFAVHNFLKDPAFSKMDFISCRNVLIYMEPYLQKKALSTFHYSLNMKGYLWLGKSETTSGVPDHYVPCLLEGTAKTDKLFIRKDIPGRFVPAPSQLSEKSNHDIQVSHKNEIIRTDFQKTADDIILSKYTPAGVVVNDALDIVNFRGKTGNFLEPSPGKASLNLLKMAKEGLAFELRNILHKAKKENITVIKEHIPIQINDVQQNISIEAIPLPNVIEPHYLVLFHINLTSPIGHEQLNLSKKTSAKRIRSKPNDTALDAHILRIQQLEKELAQSREDMRSITEEQEAANEELQSANEELLSGSEELQSLNEEMETSKEELQSTNEELTVVNQEMIGLNELITTARDYAEAIISTLHEPLLVLDENLRIKSANSSFYKTFQVNEKDTTGKLIYDLGNRQWNIPALRTLLEDIMPHNSKFESFEVTHNFPNIGERSVLLNAREIVTETTNEKLILLAIEDITEQTNARKKIEAGHQRFRNLLLQSPFAVSLCKGADMIIDIANDAMKHIWGKGKNIEGKSVFSLLDEVSVLPFKQLLLDVYNTGEPYFGTEQLAVMLRGDILTNTYYNFVYQPYHEDDGNISGIVCIAYEVTDQVLARLKVEESQLQLRNTTEHFEMATTAAEIGIWSLDVASQVLEWSSLHKKLWGYDEQRTNLVYEDWHKVILAADKELAIAEATRALVTNTPYETSYRIKPAGKEEVRWIRSSGRYLYNDVGEAVTLSGVSMDITEQKNSENALKESEERFRSLADNVPMNIFIIEPTAEANISYWNKNWLDYTGQTMEEALGRSWAGIIHPDDVQPIMDVFVPAFEGRHPYYLPGIRIKRFDGQYRWFAVQASPRYLPDGEFVGFIGVGFDIHEQKLLELELTEAKVFAENATKAKQQFLSNMSHEIRTPLNSILGFANVLVKTELDEKQKDYLRAIKTSGHSLNLLINDILDLAKVDAGKMTFVNQSFEIHKSIKSVLHIFDLKIKEKNLELIFEYDNELPSRVLGDSVRLNQIILNLMSNAIKFTNKGKIILSVKIFNEDEKNVSIEFAITDTGIGIAPGKINSIFNLFEQAEASISSSFGGTGLGLAIVKQLVENQGGSIHVNSTLGVGSTFRFILPFGQTDTELIEELPILKLDLKIKNLRILVAEDVALNQLLIKIILVDFGFKYEIVENGKLAIEKLQTNSYDIILMDLQMPEMNGYEATEYIRKIMKSDIPIIALTADVTTVDAAKCKEFGMNDYISKPIDENLLYAKIVGLIK